MSKKIKKQKVQLTPEEKKVRKKTLLKVFIFCMIVLVVLATPFLILDLTDTIDWK